MGGVWWWAGVVFLHSQNVFALRASLHKTIVKIHVDGDDGARTRDLLPHIRVAGVQ
jgi:hypothetical protein